MGYIVQRFWMNLDEPETSGVIFICELYQMSQAHTVVMPVYHTSPGIGSGSVVVLPTALCFGFHPGHSCQKLMSNKMSQILLVFLPAK